MKDCSHGDDPRQWYFFIGSKNRLLFSQGLVEGTRNGGHAQLAITGWFFELGERRDVEPELGIEDSNVFRARVTEPRDAPARICCPR